MDKMKIHKDGREKGGKGAFGVSGLRDFCYYRGQARGAHPVRGKGLKPTLTASSGLTFFRPEDERTTGMQTKGGFMPDALSRRSSHSSRTARSSPPEGRGQGSCCVPAARPRWPRRNSMIARQYGFASWPKLKHHVDSLHEAGMLKQAIDRNDFAGGARADEAESGAAPGADGLWQKRAADVGGGVPDSVGGAGAECGWPWRNG